MVSFKPQEYIESAQEFAKHNPDMPESLLDFLQKKEMSFGNHPLVIFFSAVFLSSWSIFLAQQGNIRNSIRYFQEADMRYHSSNDQELYQLIEKRITTSYWAYCLANWATTLKGSGNITKALETYAKANEKWGSIAELMDYMIDDWASCLSNWANTFNEGGNIAKALVTYAQADEKWRTIAELLDTMKNSWANCLANWATTLKESGNITKALVTYAQADEKWKTIAELLDTMKHSWANGLANWGNALMASGNITKALEAYAQADKKWRTIAELLDTMKHSWANCLANWATTLKESGNITKSLETYAQADEIWGTIAEPLDTMKHSWANCLANWACSLHDSGNIKKALETYARADEIWGTITKPLDTMKNVWANGLANWASALMESGNITKALEYYARADEKWRTIAELLDTMKHSWANGLANWASTLKASGNITKALEYYAQADEKWRTIVELLDYMKSSWASSLSNLANAFNESGNITKSLETYAQADEIWGTIAEPLDTMKHSWANCLANWACSLHDSRNITKALETYVRADEIWGTIAELLDYMKNSWANCLANWGTKLLVSGNITKALETYAQADEIWGTIGKLLDYMKDSWANCLANWAIALQANGNTIKALETHARADEKWGTIGELLDHMKISWASCLKNRYRAYKEYKYDSNNITFLLHAIDLYLSISEKLIPSYITSKIETLLYALVEPMPDEDRARISRTLDEAKHDLHALNRRCYDWKEVNESLVLAPFYPLPKDDADLNRRMKAYVRGRLSRSNGGGNGAVYLAQSRHEPGKIYCIKVNRNEFSGPSDPALLEWARERKVMTDVCAGSDWLISARDIPGLDDPASAENRTWLGIAHTVEKDQFVPVNREWIFPWNEKTDRRLLVADYVEGESLFYHIFALRQKVEICFYRGDIEDATALYEAYLKAMLPLFAGLLTGGVGHIHGRNHIHRDIKTGNILVSVGENGNPVRLLLIDYGTARELDGQGRVMDVPAVGTTSYLAPEVASDAGKPCFADDGSPCEHWEECQSGRLPVCRKFEGKPGAERLVPYTVQSDLYMCGMVLYEIVNLVQARPRLKEDEKRKGIEVGRHERIRRFLREEREILPSSLFKTLRDKLDGAWRERLDGCQAVMARALSPRPEKRYASAREMADDFKTDVSEAIK